MNIKFIEIYKFSISMHPFTIATGTMNFAQNTFIRVHTNSDLIGVGECSAFPMIVGETQNTCFEMAKDFALLWKGKSADDIDGRMQDLHNFTANNSTIKSAFDMALYDLAAKKNKQPLYQYLGGAQKPLETDLTIGIGTPDDMAAQAKDFIARGVRIIKVKLGKDPATDIERVRCIREAVGADILLRVDANQGWTPEGARKALDGIAPYDIQFCEQPMRTYNDHLLPELNRHSPVPIMADESVYDHHDAAQQISTKSCRYVNIKFAKSGGIHEALKIVDVCAAHSIPCMMGGMLESRVALSAFAHFALASDNIQFYDMDTCLLGHKEDPVKGGVRYNGFIVEVPDTPGIGADVDQHYLDGCEKIVI